MNQYVRASSMGLMLCPACRQVIAASTMAQHGHCERCGTVIQKAVLPTTDATWAWLIAALLLYIPANVLPVIRTSGIVGSQESTIVDGIVSFWQAGSFGIAVIIFIASVAVPLTKFAAIGLLLWTVTTRSPWAARQRSKLFRAVEFIGYWSMLDVIVVAITSALVQFKALGAAEPSAGIGFFCAVVVSTMFSAREFDPRLIWARHFER